MQYNNALNSRWDGTSNSFEICALLLIRLFLSCCTNQGRLLQRGVRENIKLFYNTYLPDIFDVPKYAKTLNEIAKQKHIDVSLRRSLKSIDPIKKEAVFDILTEQSKPSGKTVVQRVSDVHFFMLLFVVQTTIEALDMFAKWHDR